MGTFGPSIFGSSNGAVDDDPVVWKGFDVILTPSSSSGAII